MCGLDRDLKSVVMRFFGPASYRVEVGLYKTVRLSYWAYW